MAVSGRGVSLRVRCCEPVGLAAAAAAARSGGGGPAATNHHCASCAIPCRLRPCPGCACCCVCWLQQPCCSWQPVWEAARLATRPLRWPTWTNSEQHPWLRIGQRQLSIHGRRPTLAARRPTLAARRSCRGDEGYTRELLELVSIPSVSSLPEHQPDIERAAAWLQRRMRAAGLEVRPAPAGRPCMQAGRHAGVLQPSYSAAPGLATVCAQNVQLLDTGGPRPVVYADWLHSAGAPTVLM